ncbi:HTTM domain-containing protein [Microbacterium sp. X-17]|uniref:HTTM domain-containing protein n=1 Tax=Microbacterium sp. X-17 TaxID=3144404 RepID=UPI0031F58CDE
MLLALGTFFTLVCNPADVLFHSGDPSASHTVNCEDISGVGGFCVVSSDSLDIARLTLALLCLPAILGLLPSINGWLHSYSAFSLSSNAVGVEGGDQLTVNLAILLSVASTFDKRLVAFAEMRRPGRHVTYVFSNVVLWACTIQVAYVYVEAALVKLGHPIWAEGTALWYWVQNSGFGVSRDGEHLLLDLLAAPAVSAATTWGTMILELVIAACLLLGWRNRRVRRTALILGVCFHCAIALVMGLVTFFLAMTGALVLSCWRPRDGYSLRLFRRLRQINATSSHTSENRERRRAA